MDDPRWLRLITVGLVLSALAVGYFLLTGNFFKSNPAQPQNQTIVEEPSPTSIVIPSPTPSILGAGGQATSSASTAFDQIAQRSKGGVTILPRTGFPVGLVLVSSVSAVIVGLSLRKFPN